MNNKQTQLVPIPVWHFLHDFFAFAGSKGFKALLFVLLGAVVEGVSLVLLIPFISVVIDSQGTASWTQSAAGWLFTTFSAESRFAMLSLLVAVFAILMIARWLIIAVRDVTIAELEIGFVQHIRLRITQRLAAARWETVSSLRHSRVTHLMSAGVQQFEDATNLLLRDTISAVMFASQIALAFIIAPLLAAMALGVVLLGTALLMPTIRRARRIGSFVTNANLSLIDDTTQFLGALKLAISQNLQESFTREFEETLCAQKDQQVRYVRQRTIARLTVTTLAGIIGAVFILLGVVVFDISASVLMTLLVILSRMSGPAMMLQIDAQQIAHALPAYEKIRELENELVAAEVPRDRSDGDIVTNLSDGPIAFSGVSFLHDMKTDVGGAVGGVRDLNLIIEPGSIIGVTGPSGSGKTTFADLLVGLYAPQSGTILVGDVPLRGPLVATWRNLVSYVAQDPFLFHDTIRKNMLWANAEADESVLWNVLRLVGAEQIVRAAKRGLDTVVGERGILLSGGERQRLCLARAMLRRPHLLVLDEATSAIDIEGERVLLDCLLADMPRLAIVMIAHRQESLRRCERVLWFEDGKIVSDVSHSRTMHQTLAVGTQS